MHRNALMAAASSLAELRERLISSKLKVRCSTRPLLLKLDTLSTDRLEVKRDVETGDNIMTSRWMQTEDEWESLQETVVAPVVRRTFDCTVIPSKKRSRATKRS